MEQTSDALAGMEASFAAHSVRQPRDNRVE